LAGGGTLGTDVLGAFVLGGGGPTFKYAKRPDWLRHPDSSSFVNEELQVTGGVKGASGNALRFDLGATESSQRVAYVNTRLGRLRGRGRFATTAYFHADALNTRVATMVRWGSDDLSFDDHGYAAELLYDSDGIRCILREGPAETGSVMVEEFLDPAYGFTSDQWIEVGVLLDFDTVGNLKMQLLARTNGMRVALPYFDVVSDKWYFIGSAYVSRHIALKSGRVGWQVVSQAGAGFAQIGSFTVRADATSGPFLMPDDVTL
jgi:hypothetical protein